MSPIIQIVFSINLQFVIELVTSPPDLGSLAVLFEMVFSEEGQEPRYSRVVLLAVTDDIYSFCWSCTPL